jgi:hypothetical protein
VGLQTWTAIGRALETRTDGLPLAQVSAWILGLVSKGPRSVRMSDIDGERVCHLYEVSYGTMSDSQQSGFKWLVQLIKKDNAITGCALGEPTC